jgi:two-component system sensor histidine kinase UhpB
LAFSFPQQIPIAMTTAGKTGHCIFSFLLVSLSLLIFTTSTQAQSTYTPFDSAHVFALLSKADEYMAVSEYDSAARFCDMALDVSTRKKFLRGEAHTRIKIADIFLNKRELKNVGFNDSISLRIGLQLKDSLLIALSYYQLGLLATYEERFQQAESLFNKALQVYFEKDQSSTTAVIYNDIGYMYGQSGNLDKQLEWLMKALRLYDDNGDQAGTGQTLNNIASGLNEAGRTAEGLSYLKRSIEIREKSGNKMRLALVHNNAAQFYMKLDSLDMAIKHQQIGLKYAEQTGLAGNMVHSYITMSLLLNRQKKNAEALEYEKKAIALLEKSVDNRMQLSRRYTAAAILSGAIKDTAGALQFFKKALDISTANNNRYNLRDVYYHMAVFYKNNNDFYNAYESFKAYVRYKDSIVNTETLTKMADIETKYETEKKDKAIVQLNAGQKIKQLELEKQKAIIAGNLEESKRKQNEIDLLMRSAELQELKIKQQDEELEKSLLLAKTKEQELKLARSEKLLNDKQLQNQKQLRNAIVAGGVLILILAAVLFNRFQLKKKLEQQKMLQTVRNSIAKDLHDEIGSTLTSINILSKVSKKNLVGDIEKSSAILENITEQSQNMQQAMSDIVWAIRPDNDIMENMLVRMREYVSHTLELKNIETGFEVSANIMQQPLAMEQRRDLFLIFKEAINNASKYSKAATVNIQLIRNDGTIRMTIKDDGIGFDPLRITSSNGLRNMKERAEALNGELTIQSSPGTGTSIGLEFPAVIT